MPAPALATMSSLQVVLFGEHDVAFRTEVEIAFFQAHAPEAFLLFLVLAWVMGDVQLIALLAVPIMLFNAVGAHYLGMALGQRSPGLGPMVGATLLAATLAVGFVVALAYYGTIAAWRFDVDPDAYGIPTVTASVDFVGAAALTLQSWMRTGDDLVAHLRATGVFPADEADAHSKSTSTRS